MASDWADLKIKRQAKETSAQRPATGTTTETSAADVVPRAESPSSDRTSQPSWGPTDLPDTICIEQLAGRGRGLIARTPVNAGTTLLATKPLVSVLDSRNLPIRCSHCFRSVDELEVKSAQAVPKLLQCSLCHTLQYCSSVISSFLLSLAMRSCAEKRCCARIVLSKSRLGRTQERVRSDPVCDQAEQGARRNPATGRATTSSRSLVMDCASGCRSCEDARCLDSRIRDRELKI